MSTITVVPVVGRTALHCTYPRQSQPQDVYVTLDCRNGKLTAAYNAEIGNAVSEATWHGHVLRWRIAPLRDVAANALLAAIAHLATKVVEGYESEWSVMRGANVARYTEAANAACDTIGDMCDRAASDESSLVVAWAASDYFEAIGGRNAQASELGVTADTSDDALATIGERATADALANGVDVLTGMDAYLQRLREVWELAIKVIPGD